MTRPLHSSPNTETAVQRLPGATTEPSDLGPAFTSPSSSLESVIHQVGSPGSGSEISPLNIRGLSLPAIPLIDLPALPSASGSPLKRTQSSTYPSSSGAASSQSRFAQMIRRSPSPPKVDDSVRPSSPVRIRRTVSMGVLMGAVQHAMRRHGKGSQEPCMPPENSAGQRGTEAQP